MKPLLPFTMNDIRDSICSFEVSKLLREKGFDCLESLGWYDVDDNIPGHLYLFDDSICVFNIRDKNITTKRSNVKRSVERGWAVWAPTHQMAVEWLRVNYGVWISICRTIQIENMKWRCLIEGERRNQGGILPCIFDSPHEAMESALLEILNDLIAEEIQRMEDFGKFSDVEKLDQ